MSRPRALAYSPLPSASIKIWSPTPPDLPQAFITNTSLTAVQAMVSTPLALILSASSTKPGRCLASQVGVKAPGTEKNTTFLPLNNSSVVIFFGPSWVMREKVPAGIFSPALIVIAILLTSSLKGKKAAAAAAFVSTQQPASTSRPSLRKDPTASALGG